MTGPAHTLARRGRIPAYGRELSEKLAKAPDGALYVADCFKAAKRLAWAPRIVITPEDDPWRLDLSCARGKRVTILAGSYGAHLMPMVEALAVAGAASIDLMGPDAEWYTPLMNGRPQAVWCALTWSKLGGYY